MPRSRLGRTATPAHMTSMGRPPKVQRDPMRGRVVLWFEPGRSIRTPSLGRKRHIV